MSHVPLAAQCIYGWSEEEGKDGDGKNGSEIPGGWEGLEIVWPLVCCESKEDLRAMMGWFAEVMILNGKEGGSEGGSEW